MRITGINFLEGFNVNLSFSDGYSSSLDLTPSLAPNDPLTNPTLFLQGRTNGLTVEWPGGIDFCPDVLRVWCEAGKVLPPQETAAALQSAVARPLVP